MFYPGTKIVIVESSAKKKTLGIRAGSLGNVSTTDELMFIHGPDVAACVCTAYFTRYGFEKRARLEKKKFINVFPVLNQQKITTGKVDRHIEKIFKGEMDIIYQHCNLDFTIPVVIACPTTNCGIDLAEDHSEFVSWFHAVTTSDMLHYVASLDPLNSYHKRYFDLNDDEFFQSLKHFVNSRESRVAYTDSLIGDQHGRKLRFVRRIAAVISIYSKVTAKSIVQRTTNHISNKRKINQDALLTNLTAMFFNNSIKKLVDIPTKSVNKMIMNNIVTTGNHLWGLSHRTLGLVGDNQEKKED